MERERERESERARKRTLRRVRTYKRQMTVTINANVCCPRERGGGRRVAAAGVAGNGQQPLQMTIVNHASSFHSYTLANILFLNSRNE